MLIRRSTLTGFFPCGEYLSRAPLRSHERVSFVGRGCSRSPRGRERVTVFIPEQRKEPSENDSRATAAETLAEFAHQIYRDGIPSSVQDYVTKLIIDQLGLQLACSRLPWSEAAYDYVRDFGATGSSTVLFHGLRTHPEHAAFANATFGHGQDFDDTCQMVQTHAGAVIIPVALAVAEEVNATGEQLLRATAAGLEVMLRAAHAVSPDCLRRGHHTPPAAGPFGAAIAAGLLHGQSPTELAQSLAIAGSFSGGLIEYTQSGGSVKRIHTAIPTTAGIRAVALARRGMTGPLTVLDGAKGFVNVFADKGSVERLTDQLGTRYIIEKVGLKAYNCCYFIHAPLEAFQFLMRQKNLTPDDIAEVTVGLSAHGAVHVGTIVHPVDPLGGQFSVQFTLGMAAYGELPGLDSYSDEQLADTRFHAFADRVKVETDPVAEAEYPENWGGVVTLTTTDGHTYRRRVRYATGTPQNPMTGDEVWGKFSRITTDALDGEQAAHIREMVHDLPALDSVRRLSALLVQRALQPSR
ncbi:MULTISPECIES: MmgE/PrpD family protein [Streptomyces]